MYTYNETLARAPLETCFRLAADVERWPEILPHYRRVSFLRRDGFGRGRVRMEATRRFGPLPWPTWWESEMAADAERHRIHYRHVRGITRRMRVLWRLEPAGDRVRISIVHEWEGPPWPLIGGYAARQVIGPHFVHAIADRTLAGVKRAAERRGVLSATREVPVASTPRPEAEPSARRAPEPAGR